MKTSAFLEEIAREGEARGSKRILVNLIGGRLGPKIPADILSRIEGEQDFSRMSRWANVISNVSSFDELRTLLDS